MLYKDKIKQGLIEKNTGRFNKATEALKNGSESARNYYYSLGGKSTKTK